MLQSTSKQNAWTNLLLLRLLPAGGGNIWSRPTATTSTDLGFVWSEDDHALHSWIGGKYQSKTDAHAGLAEVVVGVGIWSFLFCAICQVVECNGSMWARPPVVGGVPAQIRDTSQHQGSWPIAAAAAAAAAELFTT